MKKKERPVGQTASISFIWSFFEKAGNQIVSLLVQIVLARILAPSDFGAMAIMVVFTNLGTTFMLSGLNTAIIQKKELEESDPSTAFWLSFAISVLFFLIIWLTSPVIASFYSAPSLVGPLRVLSLMVVFGSLSSIQTALITRALNFKRIFIASSTSLVLSAVAGIAVALAGGGVWSLVCQQLCISIVNCIALTAQTRWLPKASFSMKSAKELYSFGWKLMTSGLLESLYQSFADLIVGKLFSSSELGYFSQGRKYPQAVGWALDSAMQPVILSSISKLQDDRKQARQFIVTSLRCACFVVMPSMFFLAACANSLIPVALGEQWTPIVPVFQLFAITYAFISIQSVNLQSINAMGRSDLYLKIEILKRGLGIAVLLLTSFVLRDITAIAMGYLAVELVSTFINSFPNRQLIGYPYRKQLKDIAPIFIIAAASAIVASLIDFVMTPSFVTLFVQVLVMLVLYCALCKIFKIKELSLVKNVITRFVGSNHKQ